jgi:CcmD family protein
MENFWYVFAAFAVIWVAVLAYLFSLSQRQKRLSRDIERIKSGLKDEG